MSADVVVIKPLDCDEMPSASEALEHMPVEALVPAPAVQALGEANTETRS